MHPRQRLIQRSASKIIAHNSKAALCRLGELVLPNGAYYAAVDEDSILVDEYIQEAARERADTLRFLEEIPQEGIGAKEYLAIRKRVCEESQR